MGVITDLQRVIREDFHQANVFGQTLEGDKGTNMQITRGRKETFTTYSMNRNEAIETGVERAVRVSEMDSERY